MQEPAFTNPFPGMPDPVEPTAPPLAPPPKGHPDILHWAAGQLHRLDPKASRVLDILARYCNRAGRARPSYRTLARFTGYSHHTVRKAVGRLEEAGALQVEEIGRQHHCNTYRLGWAWDMLGAETDTLEPPSVSVDRTSVAQRDPAWLYGHAGPSQSGLSDMLDPQRVSWDTEEEREIVQTAIEAISRILSLLPPGVAQRVRSATLGDFLDHASAIIPGSSVVQRVYIDTLDAKTDTLDPASVSQRGPVVQQPDFEDLQRVQRVRELEVRSWLDAHWRWVQGHTGWKNIGPAAAHFLEYPGEFTRLQEAHEGSLLEEEQGVRISLPVAEGVATDQSQGIWDQVLEQIEQDIRSGSNATVMPLPTLLSLRETSRGHSWINGVLGVAVSSAYSAARAERVYGVLLRQLQRLDEGACDVVFLLEEEAA